jgi:hypothetical protein
MGCSALVAEVAEVGTATADPLRDPELTELAREAEDDSDDIDADATGAEMLAVMDHEGVTMKPLAKAAC